jgi:H2-forming N5,N10-methylenetetrahydromethanopterin dehydrogenase-like enzyme
MLVRKSLSEPAFFIPMAEGKKSFVLYADLIHTVNELSDVEAGKLIKHVLAYVNDLNPATDNKIVNISFQPIKQQLKRDLKHWETVREKRSEAGKASVEKKKQNQQMLTSVESVQQTPTKSTVNDSVTVNVNVNDTVNVFSIERCLEISLADPRWVKANKATKEELEIFNEYLEKIAKYHFIPVDYKKYFSTIKSKYGHLLKKEWSIDELKEMARQMDEQQKLKAV